MKYAIMIILILVGLANFLPIVGVISGSKLQALYGITFEGPDLLVLMRHRAVLFGLIGGFMIVSAFRPELRTAAVIMGYVSMLMFAALAFTTDGPGPAIRKLAVIDVILSVLLTVEPVSRVFLRG